jgi:hypothetical protein|tara:strand:- start:384 stop:578 length:195 start_codon:yes stop_codon:yes gene_type:complete
MIKYNVWTIIEKVWMDDNGDEDPIEDLKDEQKMIGRFNFIENARKYQNDLTINRPFHEDEREVA